MVPGDHRRRFLASTSPKIGALLAKLPKTRVAEQDLTGRTVEGST
jgi:hypothetical protein